MRTVAWRQQTRLRSADAASLFAVATNFTSGRHISFRGNRRPRIVRASDGAICPIGRPSQGSKVARAWRNSETSASFLLVRRQGTMRLFGFPIARYIDINDSEEGLRATQ